MPVQIKKSMNLKSLPDRISKNFSKDIKRDIADKIVERIISGKSPVEGKSFEDYSDDYAKVKGRKAPVDMLQSGGMLESLEVKQDRKGTLIFLFTSILAKYHNTDGIRRGQKRKGEARRLLKRRLLPTGRAEKFAAPLWNKIVEALKRAVKKETRRR